MDEMSKELQCSKRDAKKALLRSKKSDGIASRRLEVVRELRVRVTVMNDLFADESHQRVALERLCALRIDIKRERVVGRNGKGGTGRWPVRIVLLICELLVNGTAPRAVPANIRSVWFLWLVYILLLASNNIERNSCRVATMESNSFSIVV